MGQISFLGPLLFFSFFACPLSPTGGDQPVISFPTILLHHVAAIIDHDRARKSSRYFPILCTFDGNQTHVVPVLIFMFHSSLKPLKFSVTSPPRQQETAAHVPTASVPHTPYKRGHSLNNSPLIPFPTAATPLLLSRHRNRRLKPLEP